jgi:hypothetical protein
MTDLLWSSTLNVETTTDSDTISQEMAPPPDLEVNDFIVFTIHYHFFGENIPKENILATTLHVEPSVASIGLGCPSSLGNFLHPDWGKRHLVRLEFMDSQAIVDWFTSGQWEFSASHQTGLPKTLRLQVVVNVFRPSDFFFPEYTHLIKFSGALNCLGSPDDFLVSPAPDIAVDYDHDVHLETCADAWFPPGQEAHADPISGDQREPLARLMLPTGPHMRLSVDRSFSSQISSQGWVEPYPHAKAALQRGAFGYVVGPFPTSDIPPPIPEGTYYPIRQRQRGDGGDSSARMHGDPRSTNGVHFDTITPRGMNHNSIDSGETEEDLPTL